MGAGRVLFAIPYSRMTGDVCADFVKNKIAPALKRAFPQCSCFRMLMDSEPSFRAQKVCAALFEHNIAKFAIPSRSGDMNPVENWWSHVGFELTKTVNASGKWRNGRKANQSNPKEWQKVRWARWG